MSVVSIADYAAQVGTPNPLQFSHDDVRQEFETLTAELKEVESQIAAIKATIYAFSAIYGREVVSSELLQAVRPESRKNKRGLTGACRSVLRQAARPCSVREVCEGVNRIVPGLLSGHRSPMASVMSSLRNMERRQLVSRAQENGRSVWQLIEWSLDQQAPGSSKAQGCFQ